MDIVQAMLLINLTTHKNGWMSGHPTLIKQTRFERTAFPIAEYLVWFVGINKYQIAIYYIGGGGEGGIND